MNLLANLAAWSIRNQAAVDASLSAFDKSAFRSPNRHDSAHFPGARVHDSFPVRDSSAAFGRTLSACRAERLLFSLRAAACS